MIVREIKPPEKENFNKQVDHIIQSWQWGEFRHKEGKMVVRLGEFTNDLLSSGFQFTIHQAPLLPLTIGYLPKSRLPSVDILKALIENGKKLSLAFIKIEPEMTVEEGTAVEFEKFTNNPAIVKSKKSIFATNTFLVNLESDEEALLSNMHQKTRYNIRLAQKSGVVVEEKEDTKSFETFLNLQRETAKKQGFYTHPDDYYRLMWQTLKPAKMAHLMVAKYKNRPLTAWVLFRFKDTLYYPYGGSSTENRELMASNLMAWEVIRFGKKLGCKQFDFWGALGKDASSTDPWFGFHRFKAGYGGGLVSYVGAYDLIIDPIKYQALTSMDRVRWLALRAISSFRKIS